MVRGGPRGRRTTVATRRSVRALVALRGYVRRSADSGRRVLRVSRDDCRGLVIRGLLRLGRFLRLPGHWLRRRRCAFIFHLAFALLHSVDHEVTDKRRRQEAAASLFTVYPIRPIPPKQDLPPASSNCTHYPTRSVVVGQVDAGAEGDQTAVRARFQPRSATTTG